jgi:mono/diheme cytochrome c family protein
MRTATVAAIVAVSALVFAACSSSGGGATPGDPFLAQGKQVYQAHCATCHGTKGQGGAGMKLAGRETSVFPNINDQIQVITNGRGSMPAWGNSLSADELRAVARYERECLGATC